MGATAAGGDGGVTPHWFTRLWMNFNEYLLVPGADSAAAGQGSYLTQRWICG